MADRLYQKRNKHIYCQHCGSTSQLTANLETGKIETMLLSEKCKWPNQCPRKFVEGVFDRPFGEQIIKPKLGGYGN